MDFQPGRLAPRLKELGVDLKFGDLRWGSFLEEAGIGQATALATCTDDDMMNLQIALRARKLNPQIRVVMRILDDELSEQLRHTFNLDAAYSTSALAGPDFVSAALNRINVRRVDIEEISKVIVRLRVMLPALFDLPVPELNAEEGVTILLHARGEQVDIPFRDDARLTIGDEIVILTTEEKLADLNRRNKESHQFLLEGYSASKP
jgi:Trk K+ transport system NAD-binding subunit